MQAVILAAGMGRRLKEHTKDKTNGQCGRSDNNREGT